LSLAQEKTKLQEEMSKRIELQSDKDAKDESDLANSQGEESQQLHQTKSEEQLSEQIEEISLK